MDARYVQLRRILRGVPKLSPIQSAMTSCMTSFARALLLYVGIFALPFTGSAQNDTPGTVYTLSNAPDTNRVLTFSRRANGELVAAGAYATGGQGTGASLGSQGALALTDDGRWLLAVNAGSNELSVFSVRNDALVLSDVVSSAGIRPISVAVAHNLVYVLNAGGAENISGFYLSEHGELHAIPGATRPLSGVNVGPAQVSFGLRGDVLIVTEKTTNLISGFAVDENGRAGPVTTTPSSGAVPFGFAISAKGFLFVSEAPGSALSSYRLGASGSAELVTGSLANQQGAACWVVLSKDEKYAYTANASSDSISGYRIHDDGSVTLLNSNGLTAVAADTPIDLAVTGNGRYLYSLNAASRTIVGFRVDQDGSLVRTGEIGGLPAGVAGLAAR
jgi:6-phosphogluconolactonase (cycloisomerase 2 family)